MAKLSFKKIFFGFLALSAVIFLTAFIDNLNNKREEQSKNLNLMAQQAQDNNIPANYKLLYSQDFEKKAKLSGFEMTDPNAWRIAKEGDNSFLELHAQSKYEPRVRSPFNIAFIKDKKFGDFIMEVNLMQTSKEYGHRDMCLFFGIKDPSNFYYVHIATKADPHAHNIFLVNDQPRVAIATKTTEGIDWAGTDEWHKVRLERTIADGKVKVFFNDLENPIMEAEDTHFDYGYIGFGSFDDTGKVDNIKIWGPGLAPEKKGFFQ